MQSFTLKRKLFFFFLISLSTFKSRAQTQKDIIDTALLPFWKGKVIHNESVMMVSKDGDLPKAALLFPVRKVLSVKNSALDITYQEGKDWVFENGYIKLLKGSPAVSLKYDDLFPREGRFEGKKGGFILFNEGAYFHERQLSVTYRHTGKWDGYVAQFQQGELPETMKKLKQKLLLKLLLFGDSISAGANASASSNAAPNLPAFGDLVAEGLRRYYKSEVEFINTAVGGMDSNWGKANTDKSVIAHNPDLVVIAFGMNDGTGRMDPLTFKANIQSIIDQVRSSNPKAEFILVSTTMPNPESNFTGTQAQFTPVLKELLDKGITLVDMTEVHRELLKHKSFQDMTGNNINHPNDFLMRWYAQQILAKLIPSK
jgi:lysophospholipase L1-like esterase